jgi:DnaJ family protein C protein 13
MQLVGKRYGTDIAVSPTPGADLYQEGTVTAKTKVWAQGMEGWRLLHQVPQLKWTLVAKGTPVLNESELAILILRILIQMTAYYPSRDADGAVIRPLPTVMRVLSEPNALPHIVQLLVTFDPVLGERRNCRSQVFQNMLRPKK